MVPGIVFLERARPNLFFPRAEFPIFRIHFPAAAEVGGIAYFFKKRSQVSVLQVAPL